MLLLLLLLLLLFRCRSGLAGFQTTIIRYVKSISVFFFKFYSTPA